jgi:CheY-like chemotaxis protein
VCLPDGSPHDRWERPLPSPWRDAQDSTGPLRNPDENTLVAGLQIADLSCCLTDANAMPAGKARKRTVLVVDDEPHDRAFMRRILEEQGCTVLEAPDYWEALQIHQEDGPEIHLLLTAIALPGLNGYELANTLTRISPSLKVLFVSGPTGAEVSRFYNMPLTGPHLVAKPIQAADLIDRVMKRLRSRPPRTDSKTAGA